MTPLGRLCPVCGAPVRRSLRAKYCSPKCEARAWGSSRLASLNRQAERSGVLVVEEVDPDRVFERDNGICYLCKRPVKIGSRNSRKGSKLLSELPEDYFDKY